MNADLIQYVIDNFPHTRGNNTEICIAVWEEVARRRGVNPNDWYEMKKIIRDHKPEAVVRKRREIVKSTDAQVQKATDFLRTGEL